MAKSLETIVPKEGTIGQFKMVMFRGIKKNDWNHLQTASDAGDYGRGEYWSCNRETAESYGSITEEYIELDKVYYMPLKELRQLSEEYIHCKPHIDINLRIKDSQIITEIYKMKGCDAILTYGYESPNEYGLCIFKIG